MSASAKPGETAALDQEGAYLVEFTKTVASPYHKALLEGFSADYAGLLFIKWYESRICRTDDAWEFDDD